MLSGFRYPRTIRFHETDAAGVVYFANVLVLCHEAFEASLMASNIDVKQFFGKGPLATPVIHAEVDFRRPLFCGDEIVIVVRPKATTVDVFEVDYQLYAAAAMPAVSQDVTKGSAAALVKPLASAMTRHVSIATDTRQRQPLSDELNQWLEQWSIAD